MRASLTRSFALGVALSVCLCGGRRVFAQPASATPGVPGGANAVMKVEVSKLLDSPMGKQQGWQSKLVKGYADRPLAVPPMAKRVTVAASLNPVGMRSIWQVALVESPNPIRFDPILRAQGGYLDQIAGKEAAWTSRDIFYVNLGSNTLAVVRPGQRQLVTRWLSGKNQPALSPYLKTAMSGDAEVVFALDLDDLFSSTAIRHACDMGELPSLDKMEAGRDKLLAALATAKGLTLSLHVKDTVTADFTVDFESDVSALGELAKPFVAESLESVGLYEPIVEQWQFKAQGKRILGQGPAQTEALSRLLALLSPGNMTDVSAVAGDAPGASQGATPAADPKLDAAQASQQYYRAVSAVLDSLQGKASPAQSATWLVSKARVIEQLPILNVDPALVEWGNAVAESLNRAATELGLGQQKAMVASQGVASPTAYATYSDSGGSTTDTPETRAAYRNAQLQRRQLSQSERGAAAERALDIINQILPTRGKIRADMVQKYGVEF